MQLPQIIDIKGIRVITSKQLAEAYGTTEATVKMNFSRNRDRFIENKHFYRIR